jgi:hypothetical protein
MITASIINYKPDHNRKAITTGEHILLVSSQLREAASFASDDESISKRGLANKSTAYRFSVRGGSH